MNPLADATCALQHIDHANLRGCFCFPADLAVFDGHFPGQPLVPGITILAAAQLIVQQSQPRLILAGIPRCKWSAPLRPEQELIVEIELNDSLLAKVRFSCDGKAAGNARLQFAPA